MRASLEPFAPPSTASTSPMTGASIAAACSRSLRPLASARHSASRSMPGSTAGWAEPSARSPGERPSRWNTGLVSTATPGLISTAGRGGRFSGALTSSPAPRMNFARGWRQTGTSEPVARAASIRRGSSGASPLARASSRSAAAASDDPPPMPAATGSSLVRRNAPRARPGTRAESSRAARSTRLSGPAPAACAVGPATSSESAAAGVSDRASPAPVKATRLSSS